MVRTLSFMIFKLALFYLSLPRSAVALKINTFTVAVISSKLVATRGDDMGLELSNSFIPLSLRRFIMVPASFG